MTIPLTFLPRPAVPRLFSRPSTGRLALAACLSLQAACSDAATSSSADGPDLTPPAKASAAEAQDKDDVFSVQSIETFDQPWAMTFASEDTLIVTTQPGRMFRLKWPQTLANAGTSIGEPEMVEIENVPEVVFEGQGGLGDVMAAPDFSQSGKLYLSWVEAGDKGLSGAVVATARLVQEEGKRPRLADIHRIWEQTPKVSGAGHFSHKLLLSQDGHLFISSGDRQKLDPAQDMQKNLGKLIRLKPDGSVPDDNPFTDQGELAKQFWSIGHRNILGIAQDADGTIWTNEMGPKGGDELNRIQRGDNYGWPVVSNGEHYSGKDIPDHPSRPEFNAPELWWTPVISPASMVIYGGDKFPDWQNQAIIPGLSSEALIRVSLDDKAAELGRIAMESRMREVEEGPDGALWVLEDRSNAGLLRLLPRQQ
ncbi:PQQ-dependent sugar dehydrogenase [Allohahella marinimesophila]|uniref:PQQ-dependent sugar dehydrogenase n=1 Tax=Allohahella marinimesophila TaxID=1054972 RepID=A0ABP7PLB0_9GAMM